MIDFTKTDEEKTSFDSYEGGSSRIEDGNFTKKLYDMGLNIFRFYIWKNMYWIGFAGLILGMGYFGAEGVRGKTVGDVSEIADEIADETAGDDWWDGVKIFKRKVIKRNQTLNAHPYYHLDSVKEQEQEFKEKYGYKIKVGSLFKYYVHDGLDYLIMKSAAKGLNKDKLILELSTATGTDAEDYCDIFDAHIWDDELKEAFKSKMMIRNKKGELTQDNDDEPSHFRCVIMPDTIEDAIDD
jgi:hypothetical protein